MAKIVILTATLIAAGAEAILKAIAENQEGAAGDIIVINNSLLETSTKLKTKEKELADVVAQLKVKATELDEVQKVNDALVEELAKAQPAEEPLPEGQACGFELNGTYYRFAFHKISHGGRNLMSADVAADEKLQRELVEIGSGMIYAK